MIEDVGEGIKERLRNTFLFALAAAAVELNWRFLYTLWRSPKPPAEAIADAADVFVGGWVTTAFGYALVASIALPLVQQLGKSYAVAVEVLGENGRAWLLRRKLYDLETIGNNPEYRRVRTEHEYLQNHITRLMQRISAGQSRPSILRMEKPEAGFAYRVGSGRVVKVAGGVTLPMLKGLTYVVEAIPGTDLVMCADAGVPFRSMDGEAPLLSLMADGATRVSGPKEIHDGVAYLRLVDEGVLQLSQIKEFGGAWHG